MRGVLGKEHSSGEAWLRWPQFLLYPLPNGLLSSATVTCLQLGPITAELIKEGPCAHWMECPTAGRTDDLQSQETGHP